MMGFQSWKQALNATVIANTPMQELQTVVRETYRGIFKRALAAGTAKPTFVSYFFLPLLLVSLWLSVPHTTPRRAWVYQTRWLVVLAVVGLNLYHLLYASSTNLAVMYLAGMASTFNTLIALNLLVWTRPQFDAARVVKVTKSEGRALRHRFGVDEMAKTQQNNDASESNLRQRNTMELPSADEKHDTSLRKETGDERKKEEIEYVWQPFPAEGTFLQRFGWSVDLAISLRGAGWNISISSLPRPTLPQKTHHGAPVDMDSIPRTSRDGYSRCLTEAELLRHHSRKCLVLYLLLDLLSVMAMKDPYFILGPDFLNSYELPPCLAWMPRWFYRTYTDGLTLVAIVTAVDFLFLCGDLLLYRIMSKFFPSRAMVWHHCSAFGSLEQVLDRGMAGGWGSWWHQTFRMVFQGPVTFLLRKEYLKRGSTCWMLLSLLAAFSQSGLLHASGSITTIPPTKLWRSISFFMVQPVCILLQIGATRIIKLLFFQRGHRSPPPRWLQRTANFLYVYACYSLTARLFFDDIASCGIVMFEPVPISPLRYLGLGQPGDNWWRWDQESFPQLYSGGKHWWQSGIAI